MSAHLLCRTCCAPYAEGYQSGELVETLEAALNS